MDKEELREELIRDEGNIPWAYQDSLGYWTCGVGFLIDHRKGATIPDAVIDFWLDWHIDKIETQLKGAFPNWEKIDDVRQRVLANVAYNIGVAGLMEFKKMNAAVAADDWEEAAEQLADSKAAKQLPVRYGRLISMMRTGVV